MSCTSLVIIDSTVTSTPALLYTRSATPNRRVGLNSCVHRVRGNVNSRLNRLIPH